MAVMVAVFLVAVLAVFARPEGRARRTERLRAGAASAIGIGKTVLARGTEVLDLAAARLAQDHRSQAGLDQILAAARRRRVDGAKPSADL